MKYNVGDLFVNCNKGCVRYIDSIVETSQESTCCWYNLTYVDTTYECRHPDVTEYAIDLHVNTGSWKHYPVKKDNK